MLAEVQHKNTNMKHELIEKFMLKELSSGIQKKILTKTAHFSTLGFGRRNKMNYENHNLILLFPIYYELSETKNSLT